MASDHQFGMFQDDCGDEAVDSTLSRHGPQAPHEICNVLEVS